MSNRHDNFYDIATSSGYEITDAWVSFGGKYINIEWSSSNITGITDETYWFLTIGEVDFVASNGNFVGSVKSIKHDVRTSPDDAVVVSVIIEVPRTIDADETVTLISSVSSVFGFSSSFDRVDIPQGTTMIIRNYSSVDSNGDINVRDRLGTSPYFKTSDPKQDTDYVSSVSDANINVSDGLLQGDNITLRTRRGGITTTETDTRFNDQKTFSGNGSWIGEIDGFSGYNDPFTLFFALRMEENSSFHYSLVSESGGSDGGPVVGPGGSEIGIPPISEANIVASVLSSNTSITFEITDYWAIDETNQRHRFAWETPQNVGLGKITDRVNVFALKSDGQRIKVFGPGGKPIDDVFQETSLPSLSGTDYLAFRSEGTVQFAEILHINSDLDEIKIQEYICHMEKTYETSSMNFYVSPATGDNANVGDMANPLQSISSAVSKCMIGAGDHIFLNAGESISSSPAIDLSPENTATAPLGYSPDYPFVLGLYGTRSSGRFEVDFNNDVETYINIPHQSDNIHINGLHLKSSERQILDGSYVGQDAIKALSGGYGIYHNTQGHLYQHSTESLYVSDTLIEDCLRYGICKSSGFINAIKGSKYSATYRTQMRNFYNGKYMSENQNHGIGSSDYGVAGIFAEMITGYHAQDNMFFRIGWSPDLELDSGISVGSLEYNSNAQAFTGISLFPYLTSYDNWEGSSYAFHNNQRLVITDIDGSPTNEMNFVSSGIDIVESTIGIYLKDVPSMSGGETCAIKILDPFPRSSGNADIVIGEKSFGNVVVCGNIYVESSGYNLVSNSGYYQNGCVSMNNQFGSLMSRDYSDFNMNYFGGSVGTSMIRKAADNNGGMSVGDVLISDERDRTGAYIRSVANSKITSSIMNNNIFARSYSTGINGKSARAPHNSAIHFDKNLTQTLRCTIEKNTFYSIPGSVFLFANENQTASAAMIIARNIMDQEIDYSDVAFGSPADAFVYGFRDPHTANYTNVWGPTSFGGQNDINIYNQENLASPPEFDFVHHITPAPQLSNIGFNAWKIYEDSDFSEWTDVTYTDNTRDLGTYNSSQLNGITSSIDFVSNAIAELGSGWTQGYSAESVNTYIREGFTPTNLDQANYQGDYVGAVEFNFTPATTGFSPFFGNNGSNNHGFGKGK